ncbi:hypothetical protein Golomagni_06716 [Golovinomyces magnicellulatus]|nr:hypothetical protein Golomagni_06716 [Golovinomyces magnicellulatus]
MITRRISPLKCIAQACRAKNSKPIFRCAARRWNSDANSGINSDGPSSLKLTYPPPPTSNHHNLSTFLDYAKRSGLDEETTVYVGTHYEYTVAAELARYGFYLQRIGGASDYGTDLLGTWKIPDSSGTIVKVLIQCKAGIQRVGPQHVRELEGAFAGAPPGWRSDVMALLVCERSATKGVRDALGRSRWPMGYVFCERDGTPKQMIWNQKAEELGLAGLGVGARHSNSGTVLVLTKKGKMLPLVPVAQG